MSFRAVRLALPLTSEGETVDRVLGSITWNSAATLDKLVWELPIKATGVAEGREIAFRFGSCVQTGQKSSEKA
jgi:hypothetical protein